MRRDHVLLVAGGGAALVVVTTFGWLLADVVTSGIGELSWTFLTAEPEDAGRAGGIGSVIVSTILVVAVCLISALPIGAGAALWLSECARPDSASTRVVRGAMEMLASVPSVVFGLFGMVLFGQMLGLGFSILSGGWTLAMMVLPILAHTIHASLRAVPDDLRRGAAALGLSTAGTIRHLLLPAAARGIAVGVILGLGRALAETAALLFTSGYVTRMPESLLDSGRTLSVHVYDLAMNVPGGEPRAHATALVLIVALLAVNSVASKLASRWTRESAS